MNVLPAYVEIRDLEPGDEDTAAQLASLLVDGFQEIAPNAWPTMESAHEEVHESLGPGRISRVALDGSGTVLGWVGGIRRYRGHVWELHPLFVQAGYRGRGIGRALVADLEERVRERGAVTLWVGTDDEVGMTSLAGVDLYPDVLGHLAGIRNLKGYPYEFYERVGFVIVGAVPDANGPGKPDILMAKSV